MSRSCPFHSFQLPLHVPDIFSVCPLHFPCMSRSCVASHFPTSPVVPIGFLVPCFHFCPFHVRFSSPLFPFQFPLLSCHADFLFPPLISLHCLAFPLCSPIFPAKKREGFPSVFAKRTCKNTEFFLVKNEAGSPSQQQSRQGESSLGHLFCDTGSPKTTSSGTSSNCRAARGGPPKKK